MSPSLGRIVLVCIGVVDDEPIFKPAIVTRVWGETCINVTVYADDSDESLLLASFGTVKSRWTSVTQGDGVGQWSWPPRA